MKRLFDIILSLVLIVVLAPLLLAVILTMVAMRDLPIFYVSERMKDVDTPFMLVKFRTMRPPRTSETNTGVSGGDKSNRVTGLGKLLRRFRLDELPQLWNILKGDMGFVGPRPPLRRYTESHRNLYLEVLKSKPGVTGLASISIHGFEERVLGEANTPEETDQIYKRRCVPRKAKIDLIYQKHANMCFDVKILVLTVASVTTSRSE